MITGELEAFARIERFFSSITDLDHLLEMIIAESRDATDAEAGSLLLYDAASDELYFNIALGKTGTTEMQDKLKIIRIKRGVGVAGLVAETRKPINIADAQNDPLVFKGADAASGFNTRSLLAVPILHGHQLIGVLEVLNKRSMGGFTENDEKILKVIALQAALAIENARLLEETVRQERLAALGEGIAGAAHCIKNILNAIDGGSYILEKALQREDFEKSQKGWAILSRNMSMMRELVLDMLTYSKQRRPEMQETDIHELCDSVATFLQANANQRGVRLQRVDADQIPCTPVDPNGLKRCLLNLVGNAIDACPEGRGEIVLTIARPESAKPVYSIRIQDNGCGMNPQTLQKLFQPFFSTKGSKGTGLGLAVTRKIIHEHGGEITVQSEPGQGTRFQIVLPLCPATPHHPLSNNVDSV